MSVQLICNGCGKVVVACQQSVSQEPLVIMGTRADGMKGGSPLPNGEFHWCKRCSFIAFNAVQEANTA